MSGWQSASTRRYSPPSRRTDGSVVNAWKIHGPARKKVSPTAPARAAPRSAPLAAVRRARSTLSPPRFCATIVEAAAARLEAVSQEKDSSRLPTPRMASGPVPSCEATRERKR